MTALDWIIVVLAWSLIPAVWLLRAHFEKKQAEGERELQKAIEEWRRNQTERPS